MALNSTKDTEPSITDSKFRQSVLAAGIVKLSAASKSISGKSQLRGHQAELSVVHLLKSKNWNLVFHRAKTKIAEIDLIFEKENRILLIEVKTLDHSWRAFERILPSQILKLKWNRHLFSMSFPKQKTQALVAWVNAKNQITFTDIN